MNRFRRFLPFAAILLLLLWEWSPAQTTNHFDRYSSTLSSGYTSGGTSISVASATGLPSCGTTCYFYAVVKAEGANTEEVFLVTAISGTTLTVTGAQAGTSASNHANGASVIAPIDTSTIWTRTPDILGGALPSGTLGQQTQKNLVITSGSTSDLLSTVTASGYISELFIATNEYSTEIIVTVDGEGTPQVDANLADILGDDYADTQPASWNRWLAVSNNGAGQVGGALKIPIPFSTSVRVQAKNNAGSSATITSHIIYHTGITDAWVNTQHLHLKQTTTSSIAANTESTLLNVSSIKPGRLVGIGWIEDSFPGGASPATAPLEGAFKIYIDGSGTAGYATAGSEDFFHAPWYFNNVTGFGQSSTGTLGPQSAEISILMKASVTWGGQRFFIQDPIFFTNALKFTWTCGNTTAVNFTGTCKVISSIYYYTQN